MTQTPRQPKQISPCQEIVNTAMAWVNRQIQRYPHLAKTPSDTWPVDDSLFVPARESRQALDIACLFGDEQETKIAARAFCEAWRAIINAAKE